jgi:ATP-dependent DNA helicase RecG
MGIGIHTTTDGSAKIRIGKDCKPMTGSMRHQRSVELGIIDFTAEVIKDLTYNELSKVEIAKLKNIIRATKPEASLLKLRDEDLLKQLGIIKNDHPTIAGLLLVGEEDAIEKYIPSHEVVYLHMKSDINYDKRSDYKNGLLSVLEDVCRNIELYNNVTTVKIGLFHFEIKDFPEETYREIILNAVLHRDYSEQSAVFVRHFKDRLEISNPGGFVSGITPENILRQDSRPRNRHLAEVLRKIGLVEKAGMGVKRIFYTQLALGKETPKYISDGHSVRVAVRDGSIDEYFAKFVKESEKLGKEIGLDELLILSVLRRQRELTLNQAPAILQLDAARTREILMRMTAFGYLEKSGIKKGQLYRLSSRVCKQLGESIGYVRDKGIDEVRYPEMILQYIKKYGPISNRQVRELTGVDIYKASKLLNGLVKSGTLNRVGTSDRNARYVVADK